MKNRDARAMGRVARCFGFRDRVSWPLGPLALPGHGIKGARAAGKTCVVHSQVAPRTPWRLPTAARGPPWGSRTARGGGVPPDGRPTLGGEGEIWGNGGHRRARQTRARGVGPAGRRATGESCKRPESEQLSKRCRANERRAVTFPRPVGMQTAAAEHQTWRRRFLQRA
jgi:hypothetical protein